MLYYRFVRLMQFFKLNMKDNWELSVGEIKLWEYQCVCCDFIQIWFDNKMLSSQWDNDNQHFAYIIFSWYLLGIITRQGFLFSCSCMNRCTCYTLNVALRKWEDILQTTIWDEFTWMKLIIVWRNLFPWVQLTIKPHWFRHRRRS